VTAGFAESDSYELSGERPTGRYLDFEAGFVVFVVFVVFGLVVLRRLVP
jgi:hypothetical protein